MADITQNGAPPPGAAGTQDSGPNTPPAAHNQNTQKRSRHRKNTSQSMAQADGAVSDSVVNPMRSPRSKMAPKPRQQSVAVGSLPNENMNVAKVNGHKPRHASVGGPMIPATPAKEQAYAGPTFQASPAPSSLPVPKFFSRSVPNVAAQQQSMDARVAGDKNDHSSPESEKATPPPRAAQQSPLDIFFNADRAEKEQKRMSGSMTSPEMAARQPPPATEPRNPSGKNIFLRELDGDSDSNLSPRSQPPTNSASPPHRASSSPGMRKLETDSESEREAYTKDLKALLMNNVNGTPPQQSTPQSSQRPNSSGQPLENVFHTPSPFQRSTSGPSTPTPPTDQQNHYSLHYGNRNLSPLFKAARADTPPRPSGLRQQELASDLPPRNQPANGLPPPSHHVPQIDPNSFSRSYLDHTIRASQTSLGPGFPVQTNQPQSQHPNLAPSSSAPASQHGVQASGASPRTSSAGANGNGHDIKTMEDDLRRMLKLNVLSK